MGWGRGGRGRSGNRSGWGRGERSDRGSSPANEERSHYFEVTWQEGLEQKLITIRHHQKCFILFYCFLLMLMVFL